MGYPHDRLGRAMTGDKGKAAALAQIAALAETHNLSLDDIGGALTKGYAQDKSAGLMGRILGYVGAALIFGGLALFIGMNWGTLGPPARVVITYGAGLAAFVMALVVLSDVRYIGAATPLFIASALLLPTGMFVFLHEYVQGDDAQMAAIIVFGLCALQFLSVFWKARRTALLFFGYAFFNVALATWMMRVDVPHDWAALTLSVSMLSVAWRLDQSPHRGMTPFWYVVGGAGFHLAVFDLLESVPFMDILLIPLAVYGMVLGVRIKSRAFLGVNTVAVLSLLCYYTDEYFKDVMGWPIALMVMGALLVAIGAKALQMGRTIKTS